MDNKSPNEILTEQIVANLLEAKLISVSDKEKITKVIENGTIKDSDWRVYFETLIVSNQKEEKNED